MTHTANFTSQARNTPARADASQALSLARQALDGIKAVLASLATAGTDPYPWLTPAMRSGMSPRAQRLMRASD